MSDPQSKREILFGIIYRHKTMDLGENLAITTRDCYSLVDRILGSEAMQVRVANIPEELPIVDMYESGQVSMAAVDANGKPWVIWEGEDGYARARSHLEDDEQYACIEVDDLAWPLTVLPFVKKEEKPYSMLDDPRHTEDCRSYNATRPWPHGWSCSDDCPVGWDWLTGWKEGTEEKQDDEQS